MTAVFDESEGSETARHVTRECNLIARNFACLGAEPAAAATADHIRRFWAPRLRATVLEQAAAHSDRFSRIASGAIAVLQSGVDPETGGSPDFLEDERRRLEPVPAPCGAKVLPVSPSREPHA